MRKEIAKNWKLFPIFAVDMKNFPLKAKNKNCQKESSKGKKTSMQALLEKIKAMVVEKDEMECGFCL